ncbi:glycosyltransferase involved in cell wall biosynthesis [Salinibacter ruber]|nr:glycosyltransferase involved in cell wall biosynthesis [Salinibacter ruber]
MIVDDGSTDETKDLVDQWEEEAQFPIHYVYQSNQGKHVAFNNAVERARGRFFAVLDSDDYYKPDALENMKKCWGAIPSQDRENYAGVVGLFAYPDEKIVGDRFPESPLDCSALEMYLRHDVRGDNIGFNRTGVMQNHPFPERDVNTPSERVIVTESLVWFRIARSYDLRFTNTVFAYKDYQNDGLSANTGPYRANAAWSSRTYYQELLDEGRKMMSTRVLLKTYANYIRFTLHESDRNLLDSWRARSHSGWFLPALLVGIGLYVRDRMRMEND